MRGPVSSRLQVEGGHLANAFAHCELSTTDIAQAKKFYKSVFSWKLTDVKGMPATMIDVGTGVGGGMQKVMMPGRPTAWMPTSRSTT